MNRRDEPYEIEKGLICTLYHMKIAIKRQPIRDTVEAERTTTITLPARLTRAPRPAPTMTWASCTMQVRAAQSMPVPRLCRAGSSMPNFLRSCDKRGVLHKKKSYNLIQNVPHGPKISANVYTHSIAKHKSLERFLSSEVSYNELRIPGSLTESIACSKQMSSSLKQHITMRTIQMQVTC